MAAEVSTACPLAGVEVAGLTVVEWMASVCSWAVAADWVEAVGDEGPASSGADVWSAAWPVCEVAKHSG